jgi:hypothetical protein
MEERRKDNPMFDKLNAFGCQCAREISGLVSIAEFGNQVAAKDAVKVIAQFGDSGKKRGNKSLKRRKMGGDCVEF